MGANSLRARRQGSGRDQPGDGESSQGNGDREIERKKRGFCAVFTAVGFIHEWQFSSELRTLWAVGSSNARVVGIHPIASNG